MSWGIEFHQGSARAEKAKDSERLLRPGAAGRVFFPEHTALRGGL